MTLEIQFAPAISPGNIGSNDVLKVGLAVYRDGVIQNIDTYDGDGDTSHITIQLFNEGNSSILATITQADLAEAAATFAADHYFASKSLAALPGAQVVGFVFDLEWDNGVDPVETLTTSRFYPVKTSA